MIARKFCSAKTTLPKPLSGLHVIELEGLAIAPFVGKLLQDYGATVTRVDRLNNKPHYGTTALGHGKRVIQLDLKNEADKRTFLDMVKNECDVLIDPYRPGKMKKLNLGANRLKCINERLIYTSLTGYGHKGCMASSAGHDINYLSMSGALSMFSGRALVPSTCNNSAQKSTLLVPIPPVNFLGDFAGAGLTGSFGIMMALYERELTGKGQTVNVSVVDGVNYMTSFFHCLKAEKLWGPTGTNVIDGGAFYYGVYETQNESEFVAVGAIEPHFYNKLVKCLNLDINELPEQNDVSRWPEMKELFSKIFKSKTRDEWVEICDGTDACLTPVLTLDEVEAHQNSIESDMFSFFDGVSTKPTPPVKLVRH